jgi:hypothetical protein
MIAVFTSIELASVVPSLLNLQQIPRRHLLMGVRCESFIHSEHSTFTLGPKALAIALFLCTGIDLSRIDVGPTPDRDAWHELLKIIEFRRRVGPGEAVPPDEPVLHPQPRTLSSSQIFIGIPGSSHRLNLITSSNHMATLLAQQDEEVENALHLIDRRYIRMQELRMHIRATAQEIGVDSPTGRTRHAWLEWIRTHWNRAERFLRSFAGVVP